ncbi:MAG TPA: BON domain-containing protein [Nitrospirales bacterium]|jgi:osmotically-inducible protein OsmY
MRHYFRLLIVVVALSVLLAALGGLSRAATDEQSDQRVSDATLKSKIEERLRMDDRIDWELLDVTVEHGHATLYGEVWTDQERGMAAMIASTVPGVEGLANSIIVEPALAKDHKLTKAIWKTLRSVPTLEGNNTLKVRVNSAMVILEGTVDHPIQKLAAERATGTVPGVASVINLIVVDDKKPEDHSEKGRDKMLQEGVQLMP